MRGDHKQSQLLIFQKRYEVLPGHAAPAPIYGDAAKVKATAFLGDPNARLQTLLPDTLAFDMAINVFTYDPGATLPFVESHIMEHGMLFLAGAGVYRLGADWYPVQTGDAIWIAPYCEQWFVCMGKTQARYIYYKDVNRSRNEFNPPPAPVSPPPTSRPSPPSWPKPTARSSNTTRQDQNRRQPAHPFTAAAISSRRTPPPSSAPWSLRTLDEFATPSHSRRRLN